MDNGINDISSNILPPGSNPAPQNIARTDADVWNDILKIQANGVMMHIALYEECKKNDLCGCAAMHKRHAEEELANYLHVLGDYIDEYHTIPNLSHISPPVVKLEGTAVDEKMISCMEHYKDWEKQVCEQLKGFKKELVEGKEYVDELLDNVHQEIKCINLMCNDLIDRKYESLNSWLRKKWED